MGCWWVEEELTADTEEEDEHPGALLQREEVSLESFIHHE